MKQKKKKTLRARLAPPLVRLAERAPTGVLLSLRPALALGLGAIPGWRKRVRSSLLAALGRDSFREEQVTEYFRHLSDLFVFSAAVYRSGVHTGALAALWEHDPEGRRIFAEALVGGKGALMVCPHLIGHEIMAGTITREVPLTVLVRESPDADYEAIKQRWYTALGLEVVYRPRKGSQFQGLEEMTTALRVLRKNRVLAMTPDLVQRPGSGIPVRFFGRTVELPPGAFFLALRTGAPLLPCFFQVENGRYRLWTHAPLEPPNTGDRDADVAAIAQAWTDLFEAHLRRHPDMWQFWLDKRWAAWLDTPPVG